MTYRITHPIVLFDWDDTLVHTIKPKWAEHKEIYRRILGGELTDEQLREHWGVPFDELVVRLYGEEHFDEFHRLKQETHDKYPKELQDYTKQLLELLTISDRGIGIITNGHRDLLERDMARLGLNTDDFFFIQTSDDGHPHSKPDPRVFEPVYEAIDATPSDILFVGDSIIDHEAAHGAGIDFLGVSTGLTSADEFAELDIISVPDLGEVSI